MRFSTLAAAALSATLSSALIVGISAPSTLAPNSTFPLTLITQNYIQSVGDVAVAYGFLVPTEQEPLGFPGMLGSYYNSAYIGPEKSKAVDNVTISATVPAELAGEGWTGKKILLVAAIYSIYGASGDTNISGWNVTVGTGATTGGAIVSNTERGWVKRVSAPY
ncbi:hypothetical protein NX059_010695 [Plenodomus lindquistii]|nr:hypothetical protein NX059_010695 [Plenodomus lindquistii]